MIDLTNEQFEDLYGYNPDEDEGYDYIDDYIDREKSDWKPDFTKWVAIKSSVLDGEDDWSDRYFISPKLFWDNNGYIPDWCVGFSVPGFYESSEHCLGAKMDLHRPRHSLEALGFTIIDNPVWGRNR